MKKFNFLLVISLVFIVFVSGCTSQSPSGYMINRDIIDDESVDVVGEQEEPKVEESDEIQEDYENQTIEETIKCTQGYLNEYDCRENTYGSSVIRKYQYSDCSTKWLHGFHCGYGCENGRCRPCIDSDSGKDYHTLGYIDYGNGVKVYDECNGNYHLTENFCTVIETDYCSDFDELDYEHYCTDSGREIETIKCPYGCEDGKCKECEPLCNSDSDCKPINPDAKCINSGTCSATCLIEMVSEPEEQETVKCEETLLNEYKCNDNYLVKQKYQNSDCTFTWNYYESCEYGCSNGKCVSQYSYYCSSNTFDCSAFSTQSEAQSMFEFCGGTSNDVHWLDGDDDGIACELLP
jgi:hypothetical protein